jgi:hypothetical protein
MSTPYMESAKVTHVAVFDGQGTWKSLCPRGGQRPWTYINWTDHQERIKPWCRPCAARVRQLAADVIGASS